MHRLRVGLSDRLNKIFVAAGELRSGVEAVRRTLGVTP